LIRDLLLRAMSAGDGEASLLSEIADRLHLRSVVSTS
jgi:hypothetical protein